MKPDFALDLSHDGIGLLYRSGGGWSLVGEVKLDDPAMGSKLSALRDAAQALANGEFTTKLVLPNSQILYTTLEAPGPDDIAREVQIRGALEGLTPYAVGELVFDWRAEGAQARVAVLARETMAEAEAFAADFGFNPISFVARPDGGVFSGEPFFGKSSLAAKILGPGKRVMPEANPIPVHPKPLNAAPQTNETQAADTLAPDTLAPDTAPEPRAPAGTPPAASTPPIPAAPPALPPEIPGGATAMPEDEVEAAPRPAPKTPPKPAKPTPSGDDLLSPFPPTPQEDGSLPPPPPRKVSRPAEDTPPKKAAPKPTPKPKAEAPAPKPPAAPLPPVDPRPPVEPLPPIAPPEPSPPSARSTVGLSSLSPGLPQEDEQPANPRFAPADTSDSDLAPKSPASGDAPDTDAPDTDPAPSFFSRRRPEPSDAAPTRTDPRLTSAQIKGETRPALSTTASSAPNTAPRVNLSSESAPAPTANLSAPSAAPPSGAPKAPSPLAGSAEATRARMAEALGRPLPSPTDPNAPAGPSLGAKLSTGATALGGAILSKASDTGKGLMSRAKGALARDKDAPSQAVPDAPADPESTTSRSGLLARIGLDRLSLGNTSSRAARKDDEAPAPTSAWAAAPRVTDDDPAIKPTTGDDEKAHAPAVAAPLPTDIGPTSKPAAKPNAPAAPAPRPGAKDTDRGDKFSLLRRKSKSKTPQDDSAPAATAIPDAARSKEAESLTVFGARKPDEIGGKPQYLGLALTLVLLLLMAVVALWSTLFGADDQALFNPDPATETAAPADIVTPAEPANPAPQDTAPDVAALAPEPTRPDTTPVPTQDLDTGAVLSQEAADATYAATGVWERAPESLGTPQTDSVGDLDVASVSPDVTSVDSAALPDVTTPDAPLTAAAPPPADTSFDLNDDGLVVATSNGALSPDGILVFAGRPAVVPPLRPASLTPQTTPETETDAGPSDTDTTPLAPLAPVDPNVPNVRPRARPAGLATDDQATLASPADPALAGARPRARPAGLDTTTAAVTPPDPVVPDIAPEAIEAAVEDAIEATDPTATATRLAATTSPRPNSRPRNMARLVERARATQARAARNNSQAQSDNSDGSQVISAAAATTRPKIPSAASVARTATQKNVLNLNKVNLIGIYGSSSSRRALVRLSNGRYIKVKVGDRLDGGRVTALSTNRLTYQKGNRSVTLEAPPLS